MKHFARHNFRGHENPQSLQEIKNNYKIRQSAVDSKNDHNDSQNRRLTSINDQSKTKCKSPNRPFAFVFWFLMISWLGLIFYYILILKIRVSFGQVKKHVSGKRQNLKKRSVAKQLDFQCCLVSAPLVYKLHSMCSRKAHIFNFCLFPDRWIFCVRS